MPPVEGIPGQCWDAAQQQQAEPDAKQEVAQLAGLKAQLAEQQAASEAAAARAELLAQVRWLHVHRPRNFADLVMRSSALWACDLESSHSSCQILLAPKTPAFICVPLVQTCFHPRPTMSFCPTATLLYDMQGILECFVLIEGCSRSGVII